MSNSTDALETAPAAPRRRSGLMPRLGSALALAPLGVWTIFHLRDNLYAWGGGAAWEAHVTAPRHPLIELVTSLVVLLPLALHSVWGVRRLFISRPNLRRYPTYDNLKYVLQRVTALGLLAFIPAHLWLARFAPLIEHGRHETFADISHQMRHHAPTLVVYVLGTLGTAYHLANGVAAAGMTWGFAATPRSARRMNLVALLLFGLLLAMSWGVLYALWDQGGAAAAEVTRGAGPGR